MPVINLTVVHFLQYAVHAYVFPLCIVQNSDTILKTVVAYAGDVIPNLCPSSTVFIIKQFLTISLIFLLVLPDHTYPSSCTLLHITCFMRDTSTMIPGRRTETVTRPSILHRDAGTLL